MSRVFFPAASLEKKKKKAMLFFFDASFFFDAPIFLRQFFPAFKKSFASKKERKKN
jgi:hypothetical protein